MPGPMTDALRPHFGPNDGWPNGTPRRYEKTDKPLMLKMKCDFTCTNREGHDLQARAGDYLVQDGHAGWYPVSAEFHAKNYQLVP